MKNEEIIDSLKHANESLLRAAEDICNGNISYGTFLIGCQIGVISNVAKELESAK